MREVPTIDVAALLGGGEDEEALRVASELREAASALGFFHIVNHGIAKERMAEVLACTRAFYEVWDSRARSTQSTHGSTTPGIIGPRDRRSTVLRARVPSK